MLNDIHSRALSRRSFIVTTGAFSIAVAFGARTETADAAAPYAPNAWVTIGDDNIVTIVAPMVEMGQGVRTSLPLILAEDLDADWSKVRVSETPDDDKIYGNPIFNHQLTTVGSFSVTGYYEKLRLAGAQARKILIANAAAAWKVPAEELTTEPGMVVHAKSNRKISYGDIAKTATVPNPLPEVTKADLKPASQFRLIGKDTGRLDVPSKVNGTAQYGIDTQLPACCTRRCCSRRYSTRSAEQIDDAAAKAVKGVVKIVTLPSGVGVIAETVDAAMKAKALLKVTWSKTHRRKPTTTTACCRTIAPIAADWSQPGVEMVKAGDADAAIKGAAKVLTADYFSDHVSHMCMEPMNVTVKVDNGTIDIWSGNQSPSTMKILGMIIGKTTPDKVHVHTQLLGGGFGRRSDGDDMVMALILALNVPGKPVKMIWSREDDIRNDKLRPLTAQRLEIGLDADNNIVGWRHRIVNESYLRAHPAARSVRQDQAGHRLRRRRRNELRGRKPPRRMGALRPRRRRRRLARHRGRLHQIRHRDDDGRSRRAQEDGPARLSPGDAQRRPARRRRAQARRRRCRTTAQAQRPRGRHRLLGRAQQPHRGGGGSLASTPRPARSRSTICGRRSIRARWCSRRTSPRR